MDKNTVKKNLVNKVCNTCTHSYHGNLPQCNRDQSSFPIENTCDYWVNNIANNINDVVKHISDLIGSLGNEIQ